VLPGETTRSPLTPTSPTRNDAFSDPLPPWATRSQPIAPPNSCPTSALSPPGAAHSETSKQRLSLDIGATRTPAPNARAGREPQNPRTLPPQPPEGGSVTDSIVIEETYLTDRGRRRPRRRTVELAPIRARLRAAGKEDRAAWQQARRLLLGAVGESTFEIWLEPLELVAIDRDALLVVSAPAATASWVRERFRRLIAKCAGRLGRELRIADEAERTAAEGLATDPHGWREPTRDQRAHIDDRSAGPRRKLEPPTGVVPGATYVGSSGDGVAAQCHGITTVHSKSRRSRQEGATEPGRSGLSADTPTELQADRSSGPRTYKSAYGPAYPPVHNQSREVS